MGSTVKRQPVTFSVPTPPNYKYTNIVSFGGLECSDNPFVTTPNSASDAKNVYIDEHNALATRPRLELGYNTIWEIIRVVKFVDKKLIFRYYMSDIECILNNLSSDMPRNITGSDIINGIFLESGEKIYFFCSKGRYEIYVTNNTLHISASTEAYIPERNIGTDGGIIEDYNLLGTKYYNTYIWDGKNPFPDVGNGAITNEYLDFSQSTIDNTPMRILADYNDGIRIGYDMFGTQGQANFYYRNDVNNITRVLFGTFTGGAYYIPKNSLNIYRLDIVNSTSASQVQLSIYNTTSGDTTYAYASLSTPKPNNFTWRNVQFYITADEKTLIVNGYGTKSIVYTIDLSQENILDRLILKGYTGAELDIYTSQGAYSVNGFTSTRGVVSNGAYYGYFTANNATDTANIYKIINDTPTLLGTVPDKFKATTTNHVRLVGERDDGNLIILHKDDYLYVLRKEDGIYTEINSVYTPNIHHDIVVKGYNIFLLKPNSLVCWGDFENTKTLTTLKDFGEYYTRGFNTNTDKYLDVLLSTYDGNPISYTTDFKVSVVPLLKVFKEQTSDEIKTDLRNALLNSNLVTRFDNNWWFASGNKLFWTSYNDPTYVAETSYTELGDANDPITGFNLMGDNMLIAYKKDRMYFITPITYASTYNTYSFTETKNTVGNIPMGATISTTLTEIPLQITYDGIYGLAQVTDVASSDRISQMISLGMNSKWLAESKTCIDNCITLNRLYWTYFILPVDDNVSKVYLLDNRNSQWFYWELPIKVIGAYVENNATHFVTPNNIYYLTTTDIHNDRLLRLEYYDYGGKIIDWYWVSQLSMIGYNNYSKKLATTTFIPIDSDGLATEKPTELNDDYGFNYKFTSYRKNIYETDDFSLSGNIRTIVAVTKKTRIPRFKFLKLRLSNITDDNATDISSESVNRLRLVGIILKYTLTEDTKT